MNRVIKELAMVVSVISVSTVVVGARQEAAAPFAVPAIAAPTNAIGPKIQFADSLYDFGRVRTGDPVKHIYTFTNTGDALLVINNVQPQCGCTTAGQWTKQVEPGKTGEIPIQFNTAAYNGGVTKQVTVTCNVTNQTIVALKLTGTVYRPYDMNPQIAVFNLPPDSESASMVVTITNNMDEPLLLSAPEINNREFSAELVTNILGKAYQIKLSTVPPLPWKGNAQGHLTLKTSWTNTPVIPLTLVANVQPAVMVTPPALSLPPGPLPRALTNSVAIVNNSTSSVLAISELAVNVPGVGVELRETQPGKSFSAMLAFPQGFLVPPGQQGEFSFKTSNPKYPVVKVPVRQVSLPVPQPATVPMAMPAPLPLPKPVVTPAGPVKSISSAGDAPPPPQPPLPPKL